MKRPTSLTIISWILILMNGWALLILPFSFQNPVTQNLIEAIHIHPAIILFFNLVTEGIAITSGIFMLRRNNWARRLYLIATPVLFACTILIYHFQFISFMLIGFVVYGILAYFLTRKPVSEYLTGEIPALAVGPDAVPVPLPVLQAASAAEPDGAKKGVSILLLGMSGFFLWMWLLVSSVIFKSVAAFVFLTIILGGIAAAFMIPAIRMWNRKKWALLFGSVLAAAGAFDVFFGLIFLQMSSTPELAQTFSRLDPGQIHQMTQGAFIFGLGALVIGLLLVLYQRELNKERETVAVGEEVVEQEHQN